MKIIQKEILSGEEKEVLRELWNKEYSIRLFCRTTEDFEFYLSGLLNINHYLLVDDSNKINGWIYTFLREEEIWFGLILDHKIQGKGFGSVLLNEIKSKNKSLNGWVSDRENEIKQDGTFYKSPMQFYLKNGFTIIPEIRIENEKLSAVKINWKQ
jgi:GNAT superfamily N-acetyltransferase